jgi:hypothetical protein
MGEMKVVNMREVIGDFRTYDKDTQRGFRNVLNRTATIIKRSQKQTLKRRVRQNPSFYGKKGQRWQDRWTGNLSRSIGVKRRKWWHLEIGPSVNYEVSYAEWVEVGTPGTGKKPYGNPNARDFPGHHYVRDSLDVNKMTMRVKREIEQVIEKSQKK